MDKFLYVFLGGGIGSVLRYSMGLLVAGITPEKTESPHWLSMYPISTLIVNVLGCGLIGVAWGLSSPADSTNDTMRLALVVGVLGGFTTFSSFGWETLELIQNQRVAAAGVYVLASVLIGLAAAWGGYSVANGGA
jgi:CrcB protein